MTEELQNETTLSPYEQLKQQGEAALAQGELDKALGFYQQALELEPENPDALVNLGNVYATNQQPAIAEECHRKALVIDKNNWRANHNLGLLHKEKAAYEQAEEYYKKAVEACSDNFIPYNSLGNLYVNLKRYAEGLVFLNKALSITPDNLIVKFNIGKALLENNNPDGAIEIFQSLLETNPVFREADIYFNLSEAMTLKAAYTEVIIYLEKHINISPESYWGYRNLGFAYQHIENYSIALKCFKKALELDPDSIEILTACANIFARQGHYEKSNEYIFSIISKKSKSVDLLSWIAINCHELKEYNRSLLYLEEAIMIDPSAWRLYYQKGMSLYEMNNLEEALTAFEKIKELNGDLHLYSIAIDEVLKKSGDRQ